jgi:hypothetical protein
VTYESDEQEDFYYGEPMDGGGFAHILKLRGHEVIVLHRRKEYRAYNETPTKGTSVKNVWLKKKLLETIVGIPFAAIIGFLVIAEKNAVDKAKEHYFPEDKTEDQED